MKKLLLTTATLALLATSSAYAAEGDLYVKVNGGASMFTKVKAENGMKVKAKTNGFAGAGIGYQFMDNARVDATFDYFFEPKFTGTSTSTMKNAQGQDVTAKTSSETQAKINAILANAAIELIDLDYVKFFVTAGAGVAQVGATSDVLVKDAVGNEISKSSLKAKNKMGFAFKAGAGISMELSEKLMADIEYSYRDFGKTNELVDSKNNKKAQSIKLASHNVAFGIRFGM
jgi:opacity protein-like surface antigen